MISGHTRDQRFNCWMIPVDSIRFDLSRSHTHVLQAGRHTCMQAYIRTYVRTRGGGQEGGGRQDRRRQDRRDELDAHDGKSVCVDGWNGGVRRGLSVHSPAELSTIVPWRVSTCVGGGPCVYDPPRPIQSRKRLSGPTQRVRAEPTLHSIESRAESIDSMRPHRRPRLQWPR